MAYLYVRRTEAQNALPHSDALGQSSARRKRISGKRENCDRVGLLEVVGVTRQ